MSAILHGFFLLISALTIASVLNMIPLASLAAILFVMRNGTQVKDLAHVVGFVVLTVGIRNNFV